VAGREAPYQTTDPNLWRKGGSSFPSFHTTFAFAVGTVMAESGSDEYRWLRRVLGYGVGVWTAYERIKHNQHWLSDTVAGAAIGAASADFSMGRRYPHEENTYADGTAPKGSLSIVPTAGGGFMLSYSKEF
jgi:membrane-associated phospholipid phosphatase